MRILLIEPRSSTNFVSYSEATDIIMRPGYMPNLALPTLAALAPTDVEVTIVDELLEPIDPYLDQSWNFVGITGYYTHQERMFQIAAEFRNRGQLVGIGGAYASLSSERVRPHADVLFIGEAEQTWPQFLTDLRKGTWQAEYRSTAIIDLTTSPVPDFSKVNNDAYLIGVVQTSRGCPFECEFCDVIVYLSRKQRYKSSEQVIQELEQLYQVGYRSIFLSDDNFTAYRKKARSLLQAIIPWTQRKEERVSFTTQLSIDIARDPALLDLCAEAGLNQALVGIETANLDALREIKKRQNVRTDLVADIRMLQQRGISVQAGLITGFDSDTLDSFRLQFEFMQKAGIPNVVVNILYAMDGTPLALRLAKENRLNAAPLKQAHFGTNIIPRQMSVAQLSQGTEWLLNKLYDPDNFLARVATLAQRLPPAPGMIGVNPKAAVIWQNMIRSYNDLGPEFRHIPRQAVKLFRGKDTNILGSILFAYKHMLRVFQQRGVWDPSLAQLDAPDFESAPHQGESYYSEAISG